MCMIKILFNELIYYSKVIKYILRNIRRNIQWNDYDTENLPPMQDLDSARSRSLIEAKLDVVMANDITGPDGAADFSTDGRQSI